MSHPPLTLLALQQEAIAYSQHISGQPIKSLYGVTDGKTAHGVFFTIDAAQREAQEALERR